MVTAVHTSGSPPADEAAGQEARRTPLDFKDRLGQRLLGKLEAVAQGPGT